MPRSTKFTPLAMFFHWAVFLLITYNILQHPELEDFPPALAADTMTVHMGVGLSILILMIARLYWRMTHPAPDLPDDMPRWQQRTAHFVQWGLYLAIFAMVFLGIAAAAFAPYEASAFGIVPLSWMAPANEHIHEIIVELHEAVNKIILLLFLIHVLAAGYHAIAKKDGVLRSMLPW